MSPKFWVKLYCYAKFSNFGLTFFFMLFKSHIYTFWYNFDTVLYQFLETGTSDRCLICIVQNLRFSGFILYPFKRIPKDWLRLLLLLLLSSSVLLCLLLLYSGPASWSVHGLWPTQYGKIAPGYCNDTWKFNYDSIEPIRSKLDTYWPDYEIR